MAKFPAPKKSEVEEFQAKFPAPSREDVAKFLSPEQPEETSDLADFGTAALEGATLGFRDELLGAGQAALDVATSDKKLKDLYDLYRKYQKQEEEGYKELQERSPTLAFTGELLGGFAVPGLGAAGAIGKGASLGSKVLKGAQAGAAIGGLTGLGKSEQTIEQPLELAEEVGKSTLIGGAIGGAVPALAEGAKTAAKGAKGLLEKSDFGKSLVKSIETGLEGKGFTSRESAKRIDDLTRKAEQETTEAFYSPEGPLAKTSQEISDVLKSSSEKGAKVTPTDDILKQIETIAPIKAEQNAFSALEGAPTYTKSVQRIRDEDLRGALNKFVNNQMSPDEAYNLGLALQERGYLIKSSRIPSESVNAFTKQLGQQIKERAKESASETLGEDAQSVFQKFKSVRELGPETIMNKGKPIDYSKTIMSDYGTDAKKELFEEISKVVKTIGDPSAVGDEARNTIRVLGDRLDELNVKYPDLKIDKNKIINTLEDAGIQRDIRDKIISQHSHSPSMMGIIGRVLSVAGYGGANIVGQAGHAVTKALPKMADDGLINVAKKLQGSGAAHLGKALEDAVAKGGAGSAAKNAAIFSIMQNPEARKILDNNEEGIE